MFTKIRENRFKFDQKIVNISCLFDFSIDIQFGYPLKPAFLIKKFEKISRLKSDINYLWTSSVQLDIISFFESAVNLVHLIKLLKIGTESLTPLTFLLTSFSSVKHSATDYFANFILLGSYRYITILTKIDITSSLWYKKC